jgi:hypothetical protein
MYDPQHAPPGTKIDGNPLDSQISGALSVVRGSIVAAYPSLRVYDVVTDRGRFKCTCGGSRESLGGKESITFATGSEVWVAVQDGARGKNSFIVGSAATPIAGVPSSHRPYSAYPQTSGLDVTTKDGQATGDGLISDLYLKFEKLANNGGVDDLTEGDYLVSNYSGGGVAVEPFKVWIRGSPMSGISFFLDEDLTRLVGSNYELITLAEQYEDKMYGESLVTIRERVYYPFDALYDNAPQELDANGPLYRGGHKFLTYRTKDNIPNDKAANKDAASNYVANRQRTALIHEYKGLDGNYTLTAAGSVTLQKFAGIGVPWQVTPELLALSSDPATSKVTDFPGVLPAGDTTGNSTFLPPDKNAQPRTYDTPAALDGQLLANNLYPQFGLDNATTASGIIRATTAGQAILGSISTQGLDGFKKLAQWRLGTRPRPFFKTSDESKPRKPDEYCSDPGMWKRIPKPFVINLTPYGHAKRFYLGRAFITITEDGGIVLQDAYGSQITMSGGNIQLSAEHDIIRQAGRNDTAFVGRDCSVLASRHVEFIAKEGQAALVCSGTLSLVGGLDRKHGVNLVSYGSRSEEYGNENSGDAGGVTITSEGDVRLSGRSVMCNAKTGVVLIDSLVGTIVKSGVNMLSMNSKGMYFNQGTPFQTGSAGGAFISPSGCIFPSTSIYGNLSAVTQSWLRSPVIYQVPETIGDRNPGLTYTMQYTAKYTQSIMEYYWKNLSGSYSMRPGFLQNSHFYNIENGQYQLAGAAWQQRITDYASGASALQSTTAVGTLGFSNARSPSPGVDAAVSGTVFTTGPSEWQDTTPSLVTAPIYIRYLPRGI